MNDRRQCTKVVLLIGNYATAIAWCTAQFGKRWDITQSRSGVWSAGWGEPENSQTIEFYFVKESDAVLFALRWG
jgi:hypothetical protein